MALKMKLLRMSKNITKTELARKLEVTFRTITNWEKADGVIPSLPTMKLIAKAIGTTTYDVFSSFIFNPDEIPENKAFKFHDHTRDISKQYMTPSHPLQLFKYIKEFRLLGTGIVIYKYRLFRYEHLKIHEVPPNDEIINQVVIDENAKRRHLLEENQIDDSITRSILQLMIPSDGVVAIDENANCLILSKDNISSWHIVSNEVCNNELGNEVTHTVFEIEMTSAVFPEMEEDIRQDKKSSIYLDAYRWDREEYLPFTKLDHLVVQEDVENVIGLYLQFYRKRMGLSQSQLSQRIKAYGFHITNGTINRWESGKLLPGARQLAFLCSFFKVDIEKLLDAYHYEYYVSNGIDSVERYYNVGLHHSFGNATDFDGLKKFLNEYSFFNLTAYNTSTIIGKCSSSEQEEAISSIEISDQRIVLRLVNGNTLEFSSDELQHIKPVSLHMSMFYELEAKLHDKIYTLFFAYNIRTSLFDKDD